MPLTLCTLMHIHPSVRILLNSPVSPLEINYLLLYEVSLVLKDFSISLQNRCLPSLKTLRKQGFALVYIDDILLLSDSKQHMFHLIEQLHIISPKNNLKLAPEKLFSCALKSIFLDMKLVTIQLNRFFQKLQLSIKSLVLLVKSL